MRVSLAENEVITMAEMPNLHIWTSNHTYLRDGTNQVSMSVRTYIKNLDDDYNNSTAISEAQVIFSVEGFARFVGEMNEHLEKIKAEVAEVSEVA